MNNFALISDNYFKKESDLEKIIIEDLSVIEDGMKLIKNQYWVPGGRIDILARDKDNKLCIIELKIKDDDERIVAQCMYYSMQFKEKARVISIAPCYSSMITNLLDKIGVEMKVYKYINGKLTININKNNNTRLKFIKRLGLRMKQYFHDGTINVEDMGLLMLLCTFINFEDNSLMINNQEYLSQKEIINITGWSRDKARKVMKKLMDSKIIQGNHQKDDKRKMQYYINPEFFTEYSRSLIDKVNK
jgi:Holliday junction resolvase-like predicted endonuclease